MFSARSYKIAALLAVVCVWLAAASTGASQGAISDVDRELAGVLANLGFTGSVERTLESRLGRPVNPKLANIGRKLWHDTILGLNDDNSCSGCHSATAGFGDTQSIAIGIENNNLVGPHRAGPRNQRRTPMVINTAFFPDLMWNSRFASLSGDPFDNSKGFLFPLPEGRSLSNQPHLLTAQAFIPPTERTEAAGFDFVGDNDAIRKEVVRRVNGVAAYRTHFGKVFPEVATGAPITYDMLAAAIAEFEFTLVFANAPIDQFARGDSAAMTDDEKQGALLFFGKANCVGCHAVSGQSNEMFSDFREHVAGVPQITCDETNVVFDGPGTNEDFGLEQVTHNPAHRYLFRTSPLRNVAIQPAFFHNGAFTRLEDAIRFHLDAARSSGDYSPERAGLDRDLWEPLGPSEPVLARMDALLEAPVLLGDDEFQQLVAFVRNALLDPRARPKNLRRLIPRQVPSGRRVHVFE